jgi:hypothetical protein
LYCAIEEITQLKQKEDKSRVKWFKENWWKIVLAVSLLSGAGYVYGTWTDNESFMYLSAYLLSGGAAVLGLYFVWGKL